MDPKISVVIPVYNGRNYVAKAIESVLTQSYPPYEVIVIDDGSTDDSPKVLDQFGDRLIRRRIKNSGISIARNTGMDLVKGDYLAFIDQDDLWFKDKLLRQAEAIKKYPAIGFICCNFAVRYGFLGFRMTKQFSILKKDQLNYDEPLQEDPFKLLLREHFVGMPSTVVIKKSLIDEVGPFNPKYLCTQDYDYWMRCALKTNFVVLSEVLAYKRTHADNYSNNFVRMFSEHRILLKDTYLANKAYIEAHGLLSIYKQALAENDLMLGSACFEAGKRKEAFQYYLEALSSHNSAKNLTDCLSQMVRKSARLSASLLPGMSRPA